METGKIVNPEKIVKFAENYFAEMKNRRHSRLAELMLQKQQIEEEIIELLDLINNDN